MPSATAPGLIPRPLAAPTGPTRVVYLLGAGHSGTTLLAMLLARHKRICTVGEVKAPAIDNAEDYRCSCGQLIRQCDFWRSLTAYVGEHGVPLVLGDGSTDIRRARDRFLRPVLSPLHRGPILEGLRDVSLWMSPAWKAYRQRFDLLTVAVARGACQLTGADVFVDSSKTGLQLKYLRRNPALSVKVIRLVRDGRGVAFSYRKSDGLSISEAAHVWRRSNEEAAAIVCRLRPDEWFDLRYEDLCRSVDVTMRNVFKFIGVEPTRLPAPDGRVQHVLGNNNMRLRVGEIRLDEKWRHGLTHADLKEFGRVGGRLNRQMGYR